MPVLHLPLAPASRSTHYLGVVRFLVLTSIMVAAATAAAGAQRDALCQMDDRAPDTVGNGPSDRDLDPRPGFTTPVAALAAPVVLPAVAPVAVAIEPVGLTDALPPARIIAFAPKTSPPRARWF